MACYVHIYNISKYVHNALLLNFEKHNCYVHTLTFYLLCQAKTALGCKKGTAKQVNMTGKDKD